MATTLGAFTLLILTISAFVSFKNNEWMKFEIKEKNTALTNLNTKQEELKDRQGYLAALRKEIPEIQAERDLALAEEADLKEINSKLKSDVESKTAKVAAKQKEYNEIKNAFKIAGDPDELIAKVKTVRIKSEELDVVVANKISKLKNLNAENTSAAQLGARLKDNLDIIGRGDSLPTLKTKIRHIYPNWGFVTLASGYKSGVTGGSKLDIVRGGSVIGKLLVSTVERSSASASIVPDSIADDITLRVGDQVVPTP